MGGSSKKVTVGYKYYLGVHFGLWKGPIDAITQIKVDGRIAWSGHSTGGTIDIPNEAGELFGGDSREGGVGGKIDVSMGDSEQDINSYLYGKLGEEVPAFRGIASVIHNQTYMGNNPYLKPWSYRGVRIHTRQDGIEQWYDEMAEIPSVADFYDGVTEYETIECRDIEYDLYEHVNFFFGANEHYNPDGLIGATYADPNGPVVATISNANPAEVFIVRKKEGTGQQRAYGMGWTLGGTPEGAPWITNRFVVTTPDNNSTLYWPETFDNESAAYNYALGQGDVILTGYSSYKIWLWDDINVGGGDIQPRGGGRFYVDILKPRPEQYSCYEAYSCSDMNPAHIIRECLTDPDWGMGYAEGDIDDDSFIYAADMLWEEFFGLSITWSREGPINDFVNEMLRHIDAVLYVSRDTGKFVLKLIRDDYSESDLVTLNESNVVSVTNAVRPAIGELVSSVTVNYWDRGTGETGSLTKHNQSLSQIQTGGGSATTIAYPAVTSTPLASRLCQRDLEALSTPLLSCQIEATRIAESLNVGDAFILNWPDQGINSLVMRVQQMTLGDGEKQAIVIDALEDIFAMPSPAAGAAQGGIWVDPLDDAVDIALPRIVSEIPYYEMVRAFGVSYMEGVLDDDEDAGWLFLAAGRQGTELNAAISVDAGGGYESADSLDFCPYAKAEFDVGYKDSVIYLVDEYDIDLVESNSIAQIGDEIIRVDSIDTDSSGYYFITVGRGILDTVPAEHEAGSYIVFWGYDYSSDGVQYTATDDLDVLLQPRLGSTVLPTSETPVDEVTMSSRVARPYPPGNLKIDTESYPLRPTYGADHDITWAHRDRLQQTGDIPEDYTAGNIGPEAGTTYRVDVYAVLANETTVSLGTFSGISGTSYMLSPSDLTEVPSEAEFVFIEVTSVRDGYDSWQSASIRMLAAAPGVTRTLEDGTQRILEDSTTRKTES